MVARDQHGTHRPPGVGVLGRLGDGGPLLHGGERGCLVRLLRLRVLLLPGRIERRAFHHPHLRPDPDRIQIVHRGLAGDREPGQRREISGIQSVRIPGFGEQLLRLLRIVGRRLRLQGIVHDRRHDDTERRTVSKARCFADRSAIQRVIDGQPHAAVMPRRFGVPLLGKLDPHRRCMPRCHEREARVPTHVLGFRPLQKKCHVGFALLEHRYPRGALRDALHDQPLDAGHTPPVSGVRFQHHLHAWRVAHELVGAGPDRLFPKAIVSHPG